jgi:hypothetical protein
VGGCGALSAMVAPPLSHDPHLTRMPPPPLSRVPPCVVMPRHYSPARPMARPVPHATLTNTVAQPTLTTRTPAHTQVSLEAGASAMVTIPLTSRELSIWDVTSHSWQVVSGTFTAAVGSSSRDIRVKTTFTV